MRRRRKPAHRKPGDRLVTKKGCAEGLFVSVLWPCRGEERSIREVDGSVGMSPSGGLESLGRVEQAVMDVFVCLVLEK